MSELRALLFDLDGTLVQTRNSSWQVFRETNAEFGLGVEAPGEFFELFEENFFDSLEALARSRGVADPALVKKHFQQNLRSDYLPEIVPGIAAIVRQLASSYTLMIVSSNTMESVRRVLENNGLADCFAHVFSGEVAPSKRDAIAHVLADPSYACGRQCVPYYNESAAPHRHAVTEVMLITDTVGDVEEALKAGIRACGVAWGMHSADRLEASGAEFVCVWPEELLVYLRDGRSSAGSAGEGPPAGACAAPGGGTRAAAVAAAAVRRQRRAPPATRLDAPGEAPVASGTQRAAAAGSCETDCEACGSDVAGCCDACAAAPEPPQSPGGGGCRADRSAALFRRALVAIGD
ncbi:MAG: HAD family hydrolase [bacterium]|nr:HAD family hydrolase [bacterium]